MTEDDDLRRESDPGDRLPARTTPTWEVELLISGVAVFAMLQLPGWLDDRWFALMPRLDASWVEPFEIIYLYAKSAAVILAVTFVMHLLLRARWIAQVGMHSVHPAGIRWDRLRIGPVQREVEEQRYGSAETSIDRADNRATTVFAIGVTLASLLLVAAIAVLVGFVALQWLAQRLGLQWDTTRALVIAVALCMLPMFVANRIDRSYGTTLARGGLAHRGLGQLFALYGRLGIGPGANPTLALVTGYAGRARTVLGIVIVMSFAMVGVLMSYHAQRDPARIGQYALFPRPSATFVAALRASHYDDQRNTARDDAVPYVQSAVVTGPYLRLVVPYGPRSDGPVLARGCPARDAATSSDARAAATLGCLQGLHPVRLDGRPVPGFHYLLGADPRTDRPALVAMIDIRMLSPGQHVLAVAVARAGGAGQPPAEAGVPDLITFWR